MGSWPEGSQLSGKPTSQFPPGQITSLPAIYPISPDGPVNTEWWNRFESGLRRGYTLVQLRIPNEPSDSRRAIAERAARMCREVRCALMLNCAVPPGIARNPSDLYEALRWVEELDLAGIHLPSASLLNLNCNPFESRQPPENRLLAASCHSPEELRHAEHIGADWVCLSPIRSTPTHPAAPALGMDTFRKWTASCRLPVFGLGGLGPGDVDLVRAAGGQGVAGISAFWS